MNDDYLWDKSGKPDPEIQQLEEILGTLRYQPRELEIPSHIQMGRKSFIARGLAIAAAVALVMLGLGVWMTLQKEKTTDAKLAAASPIDEKKLSIVQATVLGYEGPQSVPTTVTPRRSLPSPSNRPRHPETRRPEFSESEVAEARIAKDQLMLALRLASSKLSFAQKKTQGNSASEIHNQHKAG
jgi:hypothetical protein